MHHEFFKYFWNIQSLQITYYVCFLSEKTTHVDGPTLLSVAHYCFVIKYGKTWMRRWSKPPRDKQFPKHYVLLTSWLSLTLQRLWCKTLQVESIYQGLSGNASFRMFYFNSFHYLKIKEKSTLTHLHKIKVMVEYVA